MNVLLAKSGNRGLGEAGGDPDAQLARDQFEQRPASRLIEQVEPACELCRQRGLSQRRQAGDDLA